MIRVKPVKRRTEPSYPTRDFLNEHPEVLYLVPQRWRHNRLVLAVLGGVLSLSLASQSQAAEQGAVSRVAPIFVHGDGRGGFGCIAINPPIFLSEDEARQVVRDEAKKAGLDFAPDALTIHNVALPVTDRSPCFLSDGDGKRRAVKPATRTGDLVLDGYDRNRDIAYEFISHADYDGWEGKDQRCRSTAIDYDVKGAAETLRKGLLANQPKAWVGVFYEPEARVPGVGRYPPCAQGDDGNTCWEKRRKIGRQLGEEELRKQVRDFLQWLKAQGVI